MIVRGRFENQRVAVVPMEGAAIAVIPGDDGDGHQLTVYLGCQMPHMNRGGLAGNFGLEPDTVRLIAPHVGGSFGAKHWAPEDIVAVRVALELDRPVKWVETRSENMIAMPHGRGQVQYLELGLRHDGTIVGLRCRVVGDAGAYGGFGGMLAFGPTRMMSQGVYRIPKIGYDVAVVATNLAPMGAYRGAGRPEAAAMLERILDMAAVELGMDPVELRRRNFLQPDEFPYSTVTGVTYDVGDYDAALTEALRIAGYDELRAEQAARRERGDTRLLGIGVSAYVEITAGGSSSEYSEVEVHPDGSATVKAGTSAHGQGHATAYSQLVSGELGIPIEQIRFVQSDTALIPRGGGTGGSRSLQLGGSAALEASRAVLERARSLAADLLEAAPEDIVVADGTFGVAGVPSRAVSWAEISTRATDEGLPLVAEHDFVQTGASFPFGAHVSVVEVDTDTGRVRARPPRRGRRLRPHPEPDARRRPGARWAGLGDRAGALGADGLRRGRQSAHVDARRVRDPERGGVPDVRGRAHRDAVAAQPARRQGHRRVGNRRQHTRGAERGGRRAEPSRCPAHRHAVHPRAGVARHRGRPGRHPARPVARAPGRLRDAPGA